MGVIVSKDRDRNSQLTDRINADLRERAVKTAKEGKDPDFAEDAEYMRDFKKTGHFGWIWAVLIVLAIASLVVIVVV